jgi:hypothetical protein
MSGGVRGIQEERVAPSSSSNDGENVIQYHVDKPAQASSGSDPSTLEAQKATTLQADGETEGEAHSAFSKNEKRFIVFMISMASFFSPLSAQIYFPVMPTLVKNYHLTTALINLTITTYLILQGLAPSFIGTFADSGGRRPAYILAFTVYLAANIGLALQNSYAALMVLRCINGSGKRELHWTCVCGRYGGAGSWACHWRCFGEVSRLEKCFLVPGYHQWCLPGGVHDHDARD